MYSDSIIKSFCFAISFAYTRKFDERHQFKNWDEESFQFLFVGFCHFFFFSFILCCCWLVLIQCRCECQMLPFPCDSIASTYIYSLTQSLPLIWWDKVSIYETVSRCESACHRYICSYMFIQTVIQCLCNLMCFVRYCFWWMRTIIETKIK